MEIFIIRHAHALKGDDDAARPLSRRGRAQIRTTARFLKRAGGLEVGELWHSPLVRARDTAVAMAKQLGLDVPLVEVAELGPGHDPALVAARLAKQRESVAIVGHEPHLSALASLLVTGRAEPPVFVLRKCAVLALGRERGRWAVLWQITPGLLA
ncbi:MAG: phosphohistidine phosphatase SixA [Opitutales bacterium]